MSLNLTIGRKMLREIVGGKTNTTFTSNGVTRFLGLSSTKPTNEAISGNNYNVTEPSTSETSYERVKLQTGTGSNIENLYFISEGSISYTYDEVDVEASNYAKYVANGIFIQVEDPETHEISYKRITTEPYDPSETYYEVIDYEIVISNDNEIHFNEALQNWGTMKYFAIFSTSTSPEPLYFGELIYEEYTALPAGTVTADNYAQYVSEGLYISPSEGVYTKITTELFDASATYYIHHDGVEIKNGTVPLVRKNQLRISVK